MRALNSLPLNAIAAAALLLCAQSAPAQTSTEDELRQRVLELEQKLQRLEQRLERQTQPPPAVAAPAPAPAPVADEPALQKQVEDLDQQVRVLSRNQELEQEAAAAKAKETPIVGAGKDGFYLKSPDNAFQIKFRGIVQADYRDYFASNLSTKPNDTFLMRRVRPVVEGSLYDKFAFLIRAEFAGANFSLLDAYVDANLWTELRLRAGKFKAPVGLERLQNAAWLQFAERAFPTLLVPNRDIGAQLFGDLLGGTVSYQIGAFDGAVDNANISTTNPNAHLNFDARLFAHPFKNASADALRGLGLGVGYTTGAQNGTIATSNLPTYLTPGQQTFFSYAAGAFANGNRVNLQPQLYYYFGPFGLLGEYAIANQTITRGTNTQDVGSSAWQLYATWVLTGEDATYNGVTPRQPFSWSNRQWGAFDINARVSELTVDDEAFVGTAATQLANPNASARKATDYGISLNWYLNRNIKLQFTYDQTSFEGGAAGGLDQNDEKIFFTRLQANY